jgi:hypothetical protein
LAHLSKENNDPALVQQLFKDLAGDVHVMVASRYEEMAVMSIGNTIRNRRIKIRRKALTPNPAQMSMF